MKKTAIVAAFLSAFLYSSAASALEWSCSDMKGLVDIMYELADILSKTPNFDQDPGFEEGMNHLVNGLGEIARDEKEVIPSFINAYERMDKLWQQDTWTDEQRDAFRSAFDSTTVNLDRVYGEYCY